jgi:hypothetical protein
VSIIEIVNDNITAIDISPILRIFLSSTSYIAYIIDGCSIKVAIPIVDGINIIINNINFMKPFIISSLAFQG